MKLTRSLIQYKAVVKSSQDTRKSIFTRIWFAIKKIFAKYEMSSSLPYARFDNQTDELELRESKEIRVYDCNDTPETVLITSTTTAEEICTKLREVIITQNIDWSLVEVWKNRGMERVLENHELVMPCYKAMERDGNRIFIIRLTDKMFDMFVYPEEYRYLYKEFNMTRKVAAKTIQKVLNGEVDPLHFSQIFAYNAKKLNPSWEKQILLLKNKTLYLTIDYRRTVEFIKKTDQYFFLDNILTSNRGSQSVILKNKDVIAWCNLTDCLVYNCTDVVALKAPSKYCLCLVTASGYKHYIACETHKSLTYWMCAMRLSKYGKQLRENYRSFVKKQNDASEYEYSKKPLPNESTRSHVAMDFKGNVGRIVEDPKEAKAIAEADTGSTRRSWRYSNTKNTPGLQAAVTKLENDIHLSQPWYHKNMSRDQAAHVLNALGNKDGVFLIRESKSKIGSYVLTFKFNGKIVHTPILAKMESVDDQVCFTLDNGVTKFYDLLQLVEFYQLNSGSLPTRLIHYVVQVTPNVTQ